MRRQHNCPPLDRVYRQFSRQHFIKYSSMFPKLHQSQLVSRIIKQWENMKQTQKEELGRKYLSKNYITQEEEKSSSINLRPQATPLKKSSLPTFNTAQTKPQKSQIKTAFRFNELLDDESEFNRHSERMSGDSRSDSSSSPKMMAENALNKLQKTSTRRRYINFYKFYYNKLKKEHSRWTPCKISSIIKLLWKREQIKGKDHKYKTKKISKFLLKDQKRVSGRTFFRAKKTREGLTPKQITLLWKQLPQESKRMLNDRQDDGYSPATHAKLTWRIREINKTLDVLSMSMN